MTISQSRENWRRQSNNIKFAVVLLFTSCQGIGMECENIILSWDNFELHTSTMLQDMLNYKNLTDITLATKDEKEIRAHCPMFNK